MRDALLLHLDNNNLINPDQHGFLTSHSTANQLLECVNNWTDAAERSSCSDVCYIDFSHAFDCVSLPKLVQKLVAYGISGNCIEWLKSFLIYRPRCVNVNHVFSDNITQLSSVPEGSVLDPFCFVLFVNDISKCVKYSKIKLDANGIKQYFHFCCDKWSDLMQIDLDAIIAWAKMWQLSISINKIYLLHIGAKNPRHVCNKNGQNIVAVETVKDLGILVTSDLNWSVQVNELVKKTNRIANVIMHAFRCHNVDLYMSVLPMICFWKLL